ncbi:MAG: metal-dependent hydrolase [Clostridia bacterium]|nr:metal-dependent hydrolase [Clostridia bacterium]
MRIAFYGHSCVSVMGSKIILIDPYLKGNPVAKTDPRDIVADYILVTHAHGDHLGDTVEIAKRTGATVIASYELSEWLIKQGVPNVHGMGTGGAFVFPDLFKVKQTQAWHSSSLPDGTACGIACGYLFWLDGVCFYHAGDTGLFSDIGRIIGKHDIDVAFLPIGGNFTMGPTDALIATGWLDCKYVVPVHYDTYSLIEQDGENFKKQIENKTQSRCILMKPDTVVNYDEIVMKNKK